jgi:hypothetical protein
MKTLTGKFGAFLASLILAGSSFAAPAAPKAAWLTYQEPNGAYKINYPAHWQVMTRGNALVITSPEEPESRGVFGITIRPGKSSIEDSVSKEFEDPERSQDLQQAPARLSDLPAIKVWGSKKGDQSTRIVEYYVQKGDHQFYVLFQAPHSSMPRFSPVFNAMISSFKLTN